MLDQRSNSLISIMEQADIATRQLDSTLEALIVAFDTHMLCDGQQMVDILGTIRVALEHISIQIDEACQCVVRQAS